MPFKHLKNIFFGSYPGLSWAGAMKVFKRDRFKCQYCGLDGLNVFENWLILTVDHVHPCARGGSRRMDNLVTACRPCNVIKGTRVFASQEDAKRYVLQKREEWRQKYHEQTKSLVGSCMVSHQGA